MELRSSRRLTRSSDPRLKQRTFSRTHAARVSSRLPSSGNNRLCRELAHSNPDAARVYQLRSGEFPVKSERHRSTSRLGLSQSAHSKVESASPKLSSGIRDNSYRGRLGNIAIPSSILRECSVCIESKGKCVLFYSSCLLPTDDRVKTPIPVPRLPPQMWSYHVCLQILRPSSHHRSARNAWAVASGILPRMQRAIGRVLLRGCWDEARSAKVIRPNFSAMLWTLAIERILIRFSP